jgi:hypothetical protein
MSAKYQIRISDLSGITETMINIPINLTPQMTDQAELVKRKFIDVEVEKAINPILDYEKARFTPIHLQTPNNPNIYDLVSNITYNVRFLNSAGFPSSQTVYSEIGMTNDDIRFGKKRYENSFLNLSFYDTDKPTTQRLLSFINIYPRLLPINVQPNGLPNPANQIPVTFILSNPIKNPAGFAEGFYLYNYKDEVTSTLPKEIYMRARFNNAANGLITNMMTEGVPYFIDDLVNKLYTKYVLYRNNTGYYYVVDETYSNNVSLVGNDLTINLYEIQAL